MSKKKNNLYVGPEHLNDEGRDIKHPAFIVEYRRPTINKIQDTPIQFIGLDVETNHITGELKLLGLYDEFYRFYTDNFLLYLFFTCSKAINENKSLAHWSRLDPYILFKLFLYNVPDENINQTLERFNNSSGEWSINDKKWILDPIVQVNFDGYNFGIVQAIRSSIKFFIEKDGEIKYIWAYDIKQLYQDGLEKEASLRLPYYSKISKESHLVDWKRFENDEAYRNDSVLKSNELDARAVKDLALSIQQDFFNVFSIYPRSLVSAGALARAGIVASLFQTHKDIEYETIKDKIIQNDLDSMAFITFYDEWTRKYNKDKINDLYCLTTEAYSGGYIESIRYGTTNNQCHYADLASAYPAVIQDLKDLRGATIEWGIGEPPHRENAYIFIRGTIDVPLHVQFNPITIKHPINKNTNIHAVGTYKASYIIEERDFMLTQGATFTNETWYIIQTNGEPSPLGKIAQKLVKARADLKAQKSTSEYMAKLAVNSMYGITFEATPYYEDKLLDKEIIIETIYPHREILNQFKHSMDLKAIKSDLKYHKGPKALNMYKLWSGPSPVDAIALEIENKGIYLNNHTPAGQFLEIMDLYNQKIETKETITIHEIKKVGYSAGEFWNPIYASYITGLTRIKIAKASAEIEKAGGKVVVIMTDSILWEGGKDLIPSDMVREKKTLGYFENPTHVNRVVCLGTGRYGYKTAKGYETIKQRGLNATEMLDLNDDPLGTLSWDKALKLMNDSDGQTIKLKVRGLVSAGVVLGNSKYHWQDIGRVVEESRKVDALVGYNKRLFPEGIKAKDLRQGLITTQSIHLMTTNGEPDDQTLPVLRSLVLSINKSEIKKEKAKQYREAHLEKLNESYNEKYKLARSQGIGSYEAKKLANLSMEALRKELGFE